MVQWIRPILQNLGFQVSHAPTPIYDYIKLTIDIIKANHITSVVRHIDDQMYYVYEQYSLLNIDPVKLKTIIQPVDIGTKSSTGSLLKRQ